MHYIVSRCGHRGLRPTPLVARSVGSENKVDSCDLCNLVQWTKEWQMLFNVEKCKIMHFGYNNPRVNHEMVKWMGLILNVF